ncbi:RNA polymerase sigma factor [Dactylosporangium sp. McL0621]|uniref:RNA polymerase sigma factor n=1 Tax=Dactylosporangium sp. McL0621 TaxID=3415678 RepID=UPI003CF52207
MQTLLERAARDDSQAWREIVERYSPLIFGICARYAIRGADAQDVCGAVWLRLVAGLREIREPRALPGWLVTTSRNECLMLLRQLGRQIPVDTAQLPDPADPAPEVDLDAGLRHETAHRVLDELPHRDRQLLTMLFSDPPVPYREISATLGIPVGAIGPNRARSLARARRTQAFAALAYAG